MNPYDDPDGEGAILKSRDGHPVPLKGMDIRAAIDDVLSRVTVTQTYENREETNIEAVYTFPLPLDGVLLDFTVTIDGRTRRGTVMKKKAARDRYEDAVEQGDTAAMLEEAGDGLYSMNVGNILAGQTIGITFSYAQFHAWNGTLLRFFLPSVIAPKYGAPSQAGIEEHLAPFTSLTARHAMTCVIDVTGSLRGCAISCPTHKAERTDTAESTRFTVSAFADRDLVLEIRSAEVSVPRVCLGRDGDGYVAAFSIAPDLGEAERKEPRDVDIVIDCSGSMSGDSIMQARAALQQILRHLDGEDRFNIIRFGSHAEALFKGPTPCSDDALRKARTLLERLDADMGGTELGSALRLAYRARSGERAHDILLITDGEVYEGDGFFKEAGESGCRIFTVGVGSAVSEGLLKRLSLETKGMAEFVTPNESMAEKIVRHFERMSLRETKPVIAWPQEPDWVWPEQGDPIFHGDTALFFARFPGRPSGSVVLSASCPGQRFSWSCTLPETADETEISNLARMAVRRRIRGRTDDGAADLAVKYALVTPLTNCLLVEENANREALGLPEMRAVPQMMAAGYGGLGTVTAGLGAGLCDSMAVAYCCKKIVTDAPAKRRT
ncbi:MAG: VWA domain-containing protein, partial [Mailhella sp.]|nr:VWA domain-containing protein [Mailhella sp.]